MTRAGVDRLAEHLLDEAPLLLRRARYRPDCCIAATRIAVEVFRSQGVHARPLAALAEVRCPRYTAALALTARDQGDEAMHELLKLTTDEQVAREWYSLGIGHPSLEGTPGRFNGHLVCIVQERLLLDLTLDQVTRPEHGILLKPVLLPVEKGALGAGCLVSAVVNGSLVRYQPQPENRAFLNTLDWTARQGWQPMVRPLTERVSSQRAA